MKTTPDRELPKALLVSIRTPEVSDDEADESLVELERLVTTLGFRVVAREWQRRPSTHAATLVGEGKLKELARFTGGKGVTGGAAFGKKSKASERFESNQDSAELDEVEESLDETSGLDAPAEIATVAVFDCDLSPSQLRHLENALGCEVLDRTGVIIEIFSRHAKARAARLQVELARLNYMAPRLREKGGPSERQAGQGAGESQLEMDKRKIRDRIAELKRELEMVQREQSGRRTGRSDQPTVALVGYTNAGKSSTMRALTGSEVLVQDKLFATLDTTVRALHPESQPRILVTDTVGFIKKLPHDLVASFRSTLDEAHNASLLLYLVDASDPTFRSQLEVTREVLSEVGVDEIPSLLVLNKADRLNADHKAALQREYPDAFMMSTRSSEDVKALRERIIASFERDMVEEEILVRYDVKGLIGEIRGSMRVVKENFEAEGVRLTVRSKVAELDRLKKRFQLS